MDKIWFGTEGSPFHPPKFQWVPAPRQGMEKSYRSRNDSMRLDNGGLYVNSSGGHHLVYSLDLFGEAHGLQGIDVYNRYATKQYGSGDCYFADPMEYRGNLFPANWAAPMLVREGYPAITRGNVTYAPANPYNVNDYECPAFDLVATAGTIPGGDIIASRDRDTAYPLPYALIPSPPGMHLKVGVTGSRTGTAGVYYSDNFSEAGASLPMIMPGSASRMNTSLPPSPSGYYIFWLSMGTNITSTLRINSMMAQLVPMGINPTLTTIFARGGGHSGLAFMDDARVEEYRFVDEDANKHYKGISTQLGEVGAWKF